MMIAVVPSIPFMAASVPASPGLAKRCGSACDRRHSQQLAEARQALCQFVAQAWRGGPKRHRYAVQAEDLRQHHAAALGPRSEEHTSELQSQSNLVCRLLLEKKKKKRRVLRMRR